MVVEDRESAALFARMLAKGIPEAELWGNLGLAWQGGIESMIPYVPGPRKPWGFLTGRIDEEDQTGGHEHGRGDPENQGDCVCRG